MKIHEICWEFLEFFVIFDQKIGNVLDPYIYIHFGASRGSLWGSDFDKNRSRIGLNLYHFHHLAEMLIKPAVFTGQSAESDSVIHLKIKGFKFNQQLECIWDPHICGMGPSVPEGAILGIPRVEKPFKNWANLLISMKP